MYYALIDARGDCSAETSLAWGTLESIASSLIAICGDTMDAFGMSMEELENEYYCDFDDYKKLEDCDKPTFDMIKHFRFTLSDCSIDCCCLVEGYDQLVKAYDEYAKDKETLNEWRLVPDIEETDKNLTILDEEIRSLNFGYVYNPEYEFLIPNFDDEE